MEYNKKIKGVYLKEDFFALTDSHLLSALILDRFVYRVFKKYGFQIFQEELDGTPQEDWNGWVPILYDRLAESVIIKPAAKTIDRAFELLVEAGLMLVQKDPSPWKKPNKYRPCFKAIKDKLEALGYAFKVNNVSLDEYEFDEGGETVTNTPLPDPVQPEVRDGVKDWESIPPAEFNTTSEERSELEKSKEWAREYRTLEKTPEYLHYPSYVFYQFAGIEPHGKAGTWTAEISGLWTACNSDMGLFVRVLERGMDIKLKNPHLTYTGPRSFVNYARDLKATEKSPYLRVALQEEARKATPVVAIAGETGKRVRTVLRPLTT